MAVSLSVPAATDDVWGRLRVRIGAVTFDASYPTGGEALAAGDFGLAEFVSVVPLPRPTGAASKRVVQWDPAAEKLVALQGDNDGVADGALVEVPNATDLSTLVVDVIVLGR